MDEEWQERAGSTHLIPATSLGKRGKQSGVISGDYSSFLSPKAVPHRDDVGTVE